MENREQMAGGARMTDAASDRHYVDWAAITGGAVVAMSIGVLATGFGAALGLSAISTENFGGSGLLALIITAVWIGISMVSAYASGGYIAGRMRRRVDGATRDEITVRDGMNGLIVWGVGILLSALLLGSAVGTTLTAVGNVAAAAGNVAAQVAGGAASGAVSAEGQLVPGISMTDPMGLVTGSMLRPATVNPATATTDATTADAASVLGGLVTTGEISDADKAYLVQLTAARTGLSQPEATARVDAAVASAQDARAKAAVAAADAEEKARDAAEAARISAILTAFLLTALALVSAVAAYVAAVKGGRHRDEGRIFGGFAYHR